LNLSSKRNFSNLHADRAALRSKAYIDIKAPEFNAVADYKWNSTLQKDEIINTNTRRWQIDFTFRHPLTLFGRPTNGYLSFNNRTYKYLQKQDPGFDVDYYNRFYVQLEQPFLLPNTQKNKIERTELNIKQERLQNQINIVSEIIGTSSSFLELFNRSQRNSYYVDFEGKLEQLLETVSELSQTDKTRIIDGELVKIEIANARETRLSNATELHRQAMSMKQRLGLNPDVILDVRHDIVATQIDIEFRKALEYALTLRPQLKIMSINTRKEEINWDNTKGQDVFHFTLKMTLGVEKNDDHYMAVWEDYNNSYSFRLSAYLPIWDWGRRSSNVEAARLGIERSQLSIAETKDSVTNNIATTVANLNDYRQRVEAVAHNLDDAGRIYEFSVKQYQEKKMSLQGVIDALVRKRDLEINYLDAYLNYRRSLLTLSEQTFFDFENMKTLPEKFDL